MAFIPGQGVGFQGGMAQMLGGVQPPPGFQQPPDFQHPASGFQRPPPGFQQPPPQQQGAPMGTPPGWSNIPAIQRVQMAPEQIAQGQQYQQQRQQEIQAQLAALRQSGADTAARWGTHNAAINARNAAMPQRAPETVNPWVNGQPGDYSQFTTLPTGAKMYTGGGYRAPGEQQRWQEWEAQNNPNSPYYRGRINPGMLGGNVT